MKLHLYPQHSFVVFCTCLFLLSCINSSAQTPQAAFTASPLQGCTPLLVTFTNQSTNAVQWQWKLGNGATSVLQNPSATYFNPGLYTITLVVTSATGLKDTLVRTNYIAVRALPQPNFTATPTSGCFPLQVQFTDNTIGNNTVTAWQWDFGDGTTSTLQNPLHTYSSAGNFSVTLIVINEFGCSKSLTRSNLIQVNTGVVSNFTVQSQGCAAPQVAQFTNTSTGTGPLTFLWDFGDGTGSSLQSPAHTYTSNGSYTVRLISINSTGCRDTLTRASAVVVGSIQVAILSPDSACANKNILFQTSSAPPPTSVLWNFGDGTTSVSFNPSKTYTQPGIYQVTLMATSGACSQTVTKNIVIVPSPNATFSASDTAACRAPLAVQFTAVSNGAQNFSWEFGDGSSSTLQNPNHTYTANGTYTVKLIASNNQGCADTVTRVNYIKISPPSFLPFTTMGCAPLTVTFNNIVQSAVPIATYYWDFGDGTTSNSPIPTHTFAAGTYNLTITVTTIDGCTESTVLSQAIRAGVAPLPAFSATPLDVCARDTVSFTDLSGGSVDYWLWDFGDGGTSNIGNPRYEYNDTGYFTVKLIVGNNGCYDSIVKTNYIYVRPPIAKFTIETVCTNRFLRVFTDQSIGADSWNWDFGDGTTSTQQNPTHTFPATGIYSVVLTVFNIQSGCDHKKTMIITVANDLASFTHNSTPGCRQADVVFTATTSSYTTGYKWYYGDGNTGSGDVSSHIYGQSGTYSISLVITDLNGCKDSISQTITILVFGPKANFSSPASNNCVQSMVTFTDLSTSDSTHPIVQWDWNYGDGTIVNNATAPFTHSYTGGGIYNVTLVVTDSYGCKDTITKNNFLTVSRPIAAFNADSVSCPGANISFNNTSTGNQLVYLWKFGDGIVSTTAVPVHAYANEGLYKVILLATDSLGCSAADTIDIAIRQPVANFTIDDSVGTCPPLIVNFTNNSENYTSLTWDFGDGGSSSETSPTHIYNTAGNYIAKLTITSPGGCTSVKTNTVRANGPSGTFIYTNSGICAPTLVSFSATTVNTNSYVWDFNDGNTLSNTNNTATHLYEVPGVYVPQLILRDTAGCTISIPGIDTIFITGVRALFIADTTLSCNQAVVHFTNQSVFNQPISVYRWDFGDGTVSNVTDPTHTYTQAGIYTVQLIATTIGGCTDTFELPAPIRIVAAPQVGVTQSPNMCVDASMFFRADVLGGDTTGVRWAWTFSNGATYSTQNTDTLLITTPGIYTYTLIAANLYGCSDTVINTFEVYPIPLVNAGPDVRLCRGTSQNLVATGANSYIWTPATGLSCSICATPVAAPDSTQLYILKGTDSNGCTNKDSILISVVQFLDVVASGGDTLCLGQSTTLSVTGASQYTWSPATGLNTTTGNTVVAKPDVTTLYTVIGKDGFGCFNDTAFVPVQVYPYPQVRLRADTTVEIGATISLVPLLSSDVTSVVWQSPAYLVSNAYPGIIVRPKTNMKYTVKVSNEGGCTAMDDINIFVTCGAGHIFIPNSFSPNADGANDVFYVRGTNVYKVKQVSIFSRWGEMVFHSMSTDANDPNRGWDGRYKGQLLNPDVYVYMIEVVCETGTTLLYKGNITLIR